jgi:hypothetical protein
MDVTTVLLSVQERDKWRHRLQLLETTLADVRARRRRVSGRLRRIKRELARISDYSDAILDLTRNRPPGGSGRAANDGRLPAR